MKVGTLRDECLTYTITGKADKYMDYSADISVEQYNAIIKIEKQFWQMQDVLKKMYEKAMGTHDPSLKIFIDCNR